MTTETTTQKEQTMNNTADETSQYRAGFEHADNHCRKLTDVYYLADVQDARQLAWKIHNAWTESVRKAEEVDAYGMDSDYHAGCVDGYRRNLDTMFPGVFK